MRLQRELEHRGLVTGNRGFDERAFGDGFGDDPRRSRRRSAFDSDFNQLLCAFAVAHQLDGEIEHDGFELGLEIRQSRVRSAADARRPRSARGKQQTGIIRRGIAIDRDRIKGFRCIEREQALQDFRAYGRIRGDKGQHGCHVRRNHA